MATKKFREYIYDESIIYDDFTIPDQSFTPRQIIEQFAGGEVLAEENRPTDEFYDDKYSDEQLVELNQTNDDFVARQMVMDFNNQMNEDFRNKSDQKSEQKSDNNQSIDNQQVVSDEPEETK